ncbi:MAG: cation transporter [Acidimicrobiia bacterium]|nr:cation transporter [Acidimicrobiia bacterium]
MTHARSLILDTCVRVVFPTALVFSLFLLFTGHNAPGGGFVGGLVAASAFVLLWVAGADPGTGLRVRIDAAVLLGCGLGISVLTAVAPMAFGQPLLDHTSWELYLGPFEKVKLTTTLAFDIGVYLVVVGLALVILNTLGRERTA